MRAESWVLSPELVLSTEYWVLIAGFGFGVLGSESGVPHLSVLSVLSILSTFPP